jgi:hypothetical protein
MRRQNRLSSPPFTREKSFSAVRDIPLESDDVCFWVLVIANLRLRRALAC